MNAKKKNEIESTAHEKQTESGEVEKKRLPGFINGPLAVALTGGMFLLSFPPYDLLPLAWIALVPLLLFLNKATWKSALVWSAALGVGLSIILVSWLRFVTYPGWFALSIYLGLYFVGFSMLFRYLRRRIQWPVTFLAPTVWLTFELIRSWILGGFEWYYLGHTQYLNLPFIQIADVVGAMALSFFVVMVSGAIVDGIILRGRALKPVIIAAVIMVAVFVYGMIRLSMYSPTPGPKVALIQGNVPIDLKHSPDWDEVRQFVQEHADLSFRDDVRDADLIIWPETMVNVPLNFHVLDADAQMERESAEYVMFIQELKNIVADTARQTGSYMMVGAGANEFVAPRKLESFNSGYLISSQGEILERYDKIHLVAFGEYMPGKSIFPVLANFRPPQMGDDLVPGEEYVIFNFPLQGRRMRFAVTICYEDTVPRVVRRFALKNPDFLVNISNDGWFKGSAELDQHLAISVFRSVETRLPMARASNTGISSIIEPSGRIQDYLSENGRRREIQGVLTGSLKRSNLNSLYLHIGQALPAACFIATGVLFVMALFRGRAEKMEKKAKAESASKNNQPQSKGSRKSGRREKGV